MMPGNNLTHLFLALFICGCVDKMLRSCHIVQRGESLWEIAQKYSVHIERLLSANPQIKVPDLIFPGQLIIVP